MIKQQMIIIWDTSNGECVVIMQSRFDNVFKKIDLPLSNGLLLLIVDHNIAVDVIPKNSITVSCTDMQHTNCCGILR